VELRGTQRRIEIARANLATQRSTLELTQLRMRAGLVSDLDVARAEAQAQTIAAQIPSFESTVRQAVHRLSVLLAVAPNALGEELTRIEAGRETAIPAAPASVPIGIPSELLRRRPDLRRAERELAAATARIGVATADLFPRFALTGTAGLESSKTNTLADSGSFVWSFGPTFRWPVLDFGRIKSQIAVENAREEQAAATYEQAVLTSLREVEDALIAFSQEQLRRESLQGAVQANRRAVSLADQLYQQGSEDFLSVLQAQRDLFVTEDSLVQSERDVATNLVALYKALGGGWEVEADAASDVSRGEAGERTFDLAPQGDGTLP
jgi:NodT family efflux transporter outer membrane factor (OMF) lipoprotein